MMDKNELIIGVEVDRCLGTNDHDLIAFNISKQRIAPKNKIYVMLQNGYFQKSKGNSLAERNASTSEKYFKGTMLI